MANKPKGGSGQPTSPTDFPSTTPSPTGTDLTAWLLNAVTRNTEVVGKIDGRLASLQEQMNRVESKVDAINVEVKGHGNWVHTLKYVLSGIGVLIAWAVAYAVGPWFKSKFF